MNDVEKKNKYSLVFCKKDNMVFISHLDVMTMFRRALRRARLPFVLTKGFSPRAMISIPRALKLGVESENELMQLILSEAIAPESLKTSLNEQLPPGIQIISVTKE